MENFITIATATVIKFNIALCSNELHKNNNYALINSQTIT